MQQRFIVQNQVPGFFIGEQLYEAFGCSNFATKDRKNELDILVGKLRPTVRLYDFHRLYTAYVKTTQPDSACLPRRSGWPLAGLRFNIKQNAFHEKLFS